MAGEALAIDLPEVNGLIQAGVAVSSDYGLSADKKLQVILAPENYHQPW